MVGAGCEEDGTAGNPRAEPALDRGPGPFEAGELARVSLHQGGPAAAPDQHAGDQGRADQHRHVAAFEELEEIGREERNIEAKEQRQESPGPPLAPAPRVAHHDVVEDRGDRHGSGDGDAVSRGQSHRLAERQDQRDAADREQVVDLRDVNLPLGVIRGVLDRHAGEIAEQHRLPGQRERPGNQGLGRDHGGGAREQDQQVGGHARRHQREEGVVERPPDGGGSARLAPGSPAPARAGRRTSTSRRMGRTPKWPMSAYKASPPVTARTTEPRMSRPWTPWRRKNAAP